MLKKKNCKLLQFLHFQSISTKKQRSIGRHTFSITVRTHRLHLLYHSWSQLSDHDAYTSTPTSTTLLNSSRLSTLAKASKNIN